MEDRECIKCSKIKPLIDFYKHRQMIGGYTNKCKSCTKSEVKERTKELSKNPEWVEKERARGREKYKRLGYKDSQKLNYEAAKLANEKYKKKYPEKVKAQKINSRMKPFVNGNQLHHWSYNEQHFRDVIELTENEHYFLHRYIRYDQNYKMYKTLGGRLLDTKESHIVYFNKIIELK